MVRVGSELSKSFRIERGLRQGCPTAPLLFNLYLHSLLKKAGRDTWCGLQDRIPHALTTGEFADDIVLLGTAEQVQENLNKLTKVTQEDGMEISTKTECMWFTQDSLPAPPLELYLNPNDPATRIKQVNSFKYLGSFLSTNADVSREIQYRLERARSKLFQIKQLVRQTSLSTRTKDNLVKSVVMPSLLYATETIPLRTGDQQRFQTLINGCLRRNRNISLRDHVPSRSLWGQAKLPPIELYLAYKRVVWMNKIQTKDKDDIIQKLTTQPENHEAKRGRPKITWWTNLKQSMTAIGIDPTCWPLSDKQLKEIHDEIRTPERMDAHYHRSKSLECARCGRRYKYNTSYEKHVSSHS